MAGRIYHPRHILKGGHPLLAEHIGGLLDKVVPGGLVAVQDLAGIEAIPTKEIALDLIIGNGGISTHNQNHQQYPHYPDLFLAPLVWLVLFFTHKSTLSLRRTEIFAGVRSKCWFRVFSSTPMLCATSFTGRPSWDPSSA